MMKKKYVAPQIDTLEVELRDNVASGGLPDIGNPKSSTISGNSSRNNFDSSFDYKNIYKGLDD